MGLEFPHVVPKMLNEGLSYIPPEMLEVYLAILPFAYAVLKVFLVVEITLICVKKWIVTGQDQDAGQAFRDNWYWD